MNSVNHGSTCPTSDVASARYTRGLTHEGPGVSISLVGGRNSSIGFNMTSNLSFHAALCQDAQKMCPINCARTIEDGSADEAIAPVAFRDTFPKYTPDRHLVCAIPGRRATAKMAVPHQSSTSSPPQTASRNSSSDFLCVLCVEGFCRITWSNETPKAFNA